MVPVPLHSRPLERAPSRSNATSTLTTVCLSTQPATKPVDQALRTCCRTLQLTTCLWSHSASCTTQLPSRSCGYMASHRWSVRRGPRHHAPGRPRRPRHVRSTRGQPQQSQRAASSDAAHAGCCKLGRAAGGRARWAAANRCARWHATWWQRRSCCWQWSCAAANERRATTTHAARLDLVSPPTVLPTRPFVTHPTIPGGCRHERRRPALASEHAVQACLMGRQHCTVCGVLGRSASCAMVTMLSEGRAALTLPAHGSLRGDIDLLLHEQVC